MTETARTERGREPVAADADELLPDYPELDRHTRPALAKLADDQLEVLLSFLRGFRTRRELVLWGQEAIVASLGELGEEWVSDLVMTGSELAAVLIGDRRHAWVESPPNARAAGEYRRALAAAELAPAFQRGFRKLRWKAVEYVNDDDDTLQPDPDVQRHPAMRPALSELAERQRWALERVLDGFADADELLGWTLRATEASYAELDDDLAADLYGESHTRELLIVEPRDHEHGPFFRASFAAVELLPAFTRAAREVSDRAGELAEQEKSQITPTQL